MMTWRVIAWSIAWDAVFTVATNLLDWPSWLRFIVGIQVVALAVWMSSRRSLLWRYMILRNWSALKRPLVFDEDRTLHMTLLPFEHPCIVSAPDGSPISGHIHTFHVVTGRPRLRAITTWRRPEDIE